MVKICYNNYKGGVIMSKRIKDILKPLDALVCLLVVAAFVGYCFLQDMNYYKNGECVTLDVVETGRYVVYEYTHPSDMGKNYAKTTKHLSTRWAKVTDGKVNVYYMPGDPAHAAVLTNPYIYLLGAVFILLFIVLDIIWLIKTIKSKDYYEGEDIALFQRQPLFSYLLKKSDKQDGR